MGGDEILDETKLIQNCQKGEKQAFNELIKFYYPYLSKFLLKLTSDQVLSEDLLQETFMKVIRNIEKFDIYGKCYFLHIYSNNCKELLYRLFKKKYKYELRYL